MNLKTLIFSAASAGILLGIASCCTKKDCSNIIYPDLYLQFDEAPDHEYFDLTIVRLDRNTNAIVDSFISFSQKIKYLDIFYQSGNREVSAFNYIIRSVYNGADTILGMTYSKQLDRIHCNTCFPGDGKADVITYANFRYEHQLSIYRSGDTLVLRK